MTPFVRKGQNLQKTHKNFCASYYRYGYINFFYLKKVGQGHRVKCSQLHNLMDNIKNLQMSFFNF